jgi:hypothetical protein
VIRFEAALLRDSTPEEMAATYARQRALMSAQSYLEILELLFGAPA